MQQVVDFKAKRQKTADPLGPERFWGIERCVGHQVCRADDRIFIVGAFYTLSYCLIV